jgi:hypothetical protein
MRMRAFALVVAAALAAAPGMAGVHFFAMTDREGGQGAPTASLKVEGWAQAGKARIEVLESDSSALPSGVYLMTLDGGKTAYLVDPREKTFAEWSGEAMVNAALLPAADRTALVNVSFSEPTVERSVAADGGTVAGRATRHYQYRTTYSTEIRTMGVRRSATRVVEDDLWVAPQLDEAGLGLWMDRGPEPTGTRQLDTAVAAKWTPYEGLPLKRVTVTTTTDAKGRTTTLETTTVVTQLETVDIPEATFTMGSGYREKELATATSQEQPGAAGAGQESGDEERYPLDQMMPSEPQGGEPGEAPPPNPTPPPVLQPGVQPTPAPQQPQPEPQPQPYPFELMFESLRR